MGQFRSYCKKCNGEIFWFITITDKIKKCIDCETLNTEKDIRNSLFNEHYWDNYRLLESRKEKINKIKKSIH